MQYRLYSPSFSRKESRVLYSIFLDLYITLM
uniref:Uncharacterized protein n=1 Tax=Myoviridae sp. ctLnO19 TaxID=2825085 RepID=A0A8S5P2C8_9CAUD|nr:MAG TPA: hypothetical protein [Myoviridae sp. ctLnO19]